MLEGRAYVLSLRWRCRVKRHLRKKFVHLMDSRVVMGGSVKGRSPSWALAWVHRQAAALILAGGLVPVLGHVRSHLNPADGPSRHRKATSRTDTEQPSKRPRRAAVP